MTKGKHSAMATERTSVVATGCREWEGRDEQARQSTEDLVISEKSLHDIIMVAAGTLLSKPIECAPPRVNPKVNYELWITMGHIM